MATTQPKTSFTTDKRVKVKLLNDSAVMPTRAYEGDAGWDLTAASVEYDAERDAYVYGTGIAVEIPAGYVGLIFPRSSNRNTECYMTNHVGVIDSGYRGEIMATFKPRTNKGLLDKLVEVIESINSVLYRVGLNANQLAHLHSKPAQPYAVGDRIGQLVIVKYLESAVVQSDELSASERDTNGHGSSGQ